MREGGRLTDGCYRFTTEHARYRGVANPVHAPLCDCEPENYSHTELRGLKEGESVEFEPPAGRKHSRGTKAKALRFEWRVNLSKRLEIVLPAEA